MATIQLLFPAGLISEGEVQAIVPTYRDGCYVQDYDPDVGLESLVCTMDRAQAKNYLQGDAMATLLSSPTNDPIRDDGLPNRPLTAFTAEVA